MAAMEERICAYKRCNQGPKGQRKVFMSRVADLKRGWGLFCSKVCKAKEQEMRTGQNAAYKAGYGKSNGGRNNKRPSKGQNLTKTTPNLPNGNANFKDPDPFKLGNNYMNSGVDRETFEYYQEQYGGYPQFSRSGEYEGTCLPPFDNSTDHQNSGGDIPIR